MSMSTGLIRRLTSEKDDEPMEKRLRLAKNVFFSADLPIIRKEECIFNWLFSQLTEEQGSCIWKTTECCLASEPRVFLKLLPETKDLLVNKLITSLDNYPKCKVSEEMLKCCMHIFSSVSYQSYSKESCMIVLVKSLMKFTYQVLISNENSIETELKIIQLAVECTEKAIGSFSHVCRHQFSDKQNLIGIFIEEFLFPLAILTREIKLHKVSSKLNIEQEKCIKRLLLGPLKRMKELTDKSTEEDNETEIILNSLKSKISTSSVDDTKAALICIFQCAVPNFLPNSSLIDIILRSLVDCCNKKEKRKQVLKALLESSTEVSYDYNNKVNELTLSEYLKNQIEGIMTMEKSLKYSDYELLSAITKLNPTIVEEQTQKILEKVFFEIKKKDQDKLAYRILIKELWKASVRLRRQHKFLSKFLISLNCPIKLEDTTLEFIDNFNLPVEFVNEFNEDLRKSTNSAQIMAIFHTLIFHLKTDCINNLKCSNISPQTCLMSKVISKFFFSFFENSNFLENSLPKDWKSKFLLAFTDLSSNLISFSNEFCSAIEKNEIIFISFVNLIQIWLEVNNTLCYYMSDVGAKQIEFPLSDSQLKVLKKYCKKINNNDCPKSLSKILLLKEFFCNVNKSECIKQEYIMDHWPLVLENYFNFVQTLNSKQILVLADQLDKEIIHSQSNLIKWKTTLQGNISRMTEKLVCGLALQTMANLVPGSVNCATKTILENIEFENVLDHVDDASNLLNVLKISKDKISKQCFQSIIIEDLEEAKRRVDFLSTIPLSYLNKTIREFLFLVMYSFEVESKNCFDPKDNMIKIYTDLLQHRDINIVGCVSEQYKLVDHFKSYETVFLQICKLSLFNSSSLDLWESFALADDCDEKIRCSVLVCIDSCKSKASSNEHKVFLTDLATKIIKKITKGLKDGVKNSVEVAALRISLKMILLNNMKLKSSLKKCIENTLLIISQNKISDESFIQECLLLALLTLSHRDIFDISEEMVKKVCVSLINNPDGISFSSFLEVLKDNEFQYFANILCSQMKKHQACENIAGLEKATVIWENLSKVESKASRTKFLCATVTNGLLKDIIGSEIKKASALFVLKMCRTFVTSKRMIRLSDKIIDSIFVISSDCLNKHCDDTVLPISKEALGLCLDLLRSGTELLLDRLPALSNLFRKIAKIIFTEIQINDFSNEHELRILAVDVEKFCTFYAKLKKNVGRISSYLIADLIEISHQSSALPPYLKSAIDNSVSHLLINCDQYAVNFLSRTLPLSTQPLFKTIYENYKNYHRYTGKI